METNQSASMTGRRTSNTWESGASLRAKPSSAGSLRSQGGDGSTWAAVVAPYRNACRPLCTKISPGDRPAEGQLAYARARLPSRVASFKKGDATALPFPENTFDAAVMPLVIFFVPSRPRAWLKWPEWFAGAVMVSAYAWDMVGQGFPYETLRAEMRALGVEVPVPPSSDVSRIDALQEL